MRPGRAALALGAACLLASGPARAQVAMDVDVAASAGHYRSAPGPSTSATRVGAMPGVTLQFGTPRLLGAARYRFAGATYVQGSHGGTYANTLSLGLQAQPTLRSTLGVVVDASQGSTFDLAIFRDPAAGDTSLRANDDLARVSGLLGQVFTYEASESFRLMQGLSVQAGAPQHHLERVSTVGAFSAGFAWLLRRDAIGAMAQARYAMLRPAGVDLPPREGSSLCPVRGCVEAVQTSTTATWSRDVTQRLNVRGAAGVETLALQGTARTSVVPTGSIDANYLFGRLGLSGGFRHGVTANLEEGTMGLSDAGAVRAGWILRDVPARAVSGSLGAMRTRPLVSAGAAAAHGSALLADLGLDWSLSGPWALTARYSFSLQYERDEPGPRRLGIHAFDVGIAWHSNPGLARASGPPSSGTRVDGSDRTAFPGESRGGE